MDALEQDNGISGVVEISENNGEPAKPDEREKEDNFTHSNVLPFKKRRCTTASSTAEEAISETVTSSVKAAGRKRSKSIPIIDLTEVDEITLAPAVIDLTKETLPVLRKDKVCSNDAYLFIKLPSNLIKLVMKYAATIGGRGLPVTVFLFAKQDEIKISGPREDANRALNLLQSIEWQSDRLFYNCPELSSYFKCDSWKDFVKVLESEIRCVIQVKKKDVTAEVQQASDSNYTNTDLPFIQNSSDRTTNPIQTSQSVDSFLNLLNADGAAPSQEAPINESQALPSQTPVDMRTNLFSSDLLPSETFSQQKTDKTGNLPELHTSETKYGNITVKVCYGDISQDNSAAIVNGVTAKFDLSLGALSSSIVASAGPKIVQACQFADRSNPLLRVTFGYNLPCKYVFHLVTPRNIDDYVHNLMQVLTCAEKFQLPSIALPALGTGDIGLNPLEVSNRTVEAINKFVASQVRYVKTIKLVIFNTNLFYIFRSNIVTSKVVGGYGYRRAVEVDAEITRRNMSLGMVINICSDKKESVAMAMERVQKHMEKCIRKKSINSELILKLNSHDSIDIYLASVPCLAAVTYLSSQITLVGLPDNLDKLHDFVRGIGFEIREAETLSKICSWQWEIGFDSFENLPIRVSAELEKLYGCHTQDKTLAEVRLYGEKFRVDFTSMMYEFNSVFGRVRRLNQQSDLPPHWSDMKDNSMLRVPLDPHASAEYGHVVNQFLNSNPQFKSVVQVERIQNPALYKQYLVKKADVESHMTSGLPVERNLFHGTSEADAMKICTDGFDRGFAGKNATMFGKGTYFAVDSAYSMRFAHGSNGSVRMMFLASVLTGDYAQGSASLMAAPEKGSPSNRRYDSVVDRLTNPTMYVVFRDSSVYPSYLIHFV